MPKPIVLFGRNPAILALMASQVSAIGHKTEVFLDEALMIGRLRQGSVGMVILGPAVEMEPRMNCRALCEELGIPLLEHEGGPDNLIKNVEAAMAEREA